MAGPIHAGLGDSWPAPPIGSRCLCPAASQGEAGTRLPPSSELSSLFASVSAVTKGVKNSAMQQPSDHLSMQMGSYDLEPKRSSGAL